MRPTIFTQLTLPLPLACSYAYIIELVYSTHKKQTKAATPTTMSTDHHTTTTTMPTTVGKKSAKKARRKAYKTVGASALKVQKKATARKHNRERPSRKERAQLKFVKAFDRMLSIDSGGKGGTAVIFRVGMKAESKQNGTKNMNTNKNKNNNKGKQAIKTEEKSKETKLCALTFPPPTFVLDQDQDQGGQSVTFHPPTFGRVTPLGEESGSSFVKNQRVAYFHKASDTWIEDACIVGVHHDDKVDQPPSYTIRYQHSDSEEPIEEQTAHDRLKIPSWDQEWTSRRSTSMDA
jgi:hypothetical protein